MKFLDFSLDYKLRSGQNSFNVQCHLLCYTRSQNINLVLHPSPMRSNRTSSIIVNINNICTRVQNEIWRLLARILRVPRNETSNKAPLESKAKLGLTSSELILKSVCWAGGWQPGARAINIFALSGLSTVSGAKFQLIPAQTGGVFTQS